jgi:hypothetical protein
MADWKNRIIGLGAEDPTQILANPLNFRRHPAAQRAALRGSLDTVGWVQVPTINKQTGFLVDGHARVEEAISRNEKAIPVLYVDLTPEEERLILASEDQIGAMAELDNLRLNELLEDMHVDDVGLQSLLDSLNEQAKPEKDKTAPEGPTDEVTCPACGETFNIGVRVKPKPGGPSGNEMSGGN